MNTESIPRIVCAAVRSANGDVLLGIRHYSPDMLEQMRQRTDGQAFSHRLGEDQGFVDQFGKYYNREQAYIIAKDAGQIIREYACTIRYGIKQLFSEALY